MMVAPDGAPNSRLPMSYPILAYCYTQRQKHKKKEKKKKRKKKQKKRKKRKKGKEIRKKLENEKREQRNIKQEPTEPPVCRTKMPFIKDSQISAFCFITSERSSSTLVKVNYLS